MSWQKSLSRISPNISKLKAGEIKVIDGIVMGLEPKAPPKTLLLSGLPEKYSKSLAPAFAELETPKLEESKMIVAQKKIITTLADYYGEHLPGRKKTQLKTLYSNAFDNTIKILRQIKDKKIEPKKAQQEIAKISGNIVLDEMKIFAGNQKAQSRRYRKWRGRRVSDTPQIRNLLGKAYSDLITGKYLKTDKKVISKEQALLEKPYSSQARAIMGKAKFITPYKTYYFASDVVKTVGSLLLDTIPDPTSFVPQYVWQEEVHSSTDLGWSVKIFSAEHSVLSDTVNQALSTMTGVDWSDITSDVGLVHVSIVAGLWKQTKEHILIKKVTANTVPPRVVSENRVTRYSAQFHSPWLVANGCASWFRSDDELRLLKDVYFNSYDAAIKYAKGQTPTPGGKYYPIRACAYSVGTWGINWTCHQCANAFTRRKWAFTGIYYPTNNIYGTTGNFYIPGIGSVPISKRKCPLTQYYPLRGGVPGSWLYYNVNPLYSAIGFALDPFMDGGGFGLDTRWNPKKNQWQPTHASYTSRSIPFGGPNWVSTYSGWE